MLIFDDSTVLVNAQRLATIRAADRIVVLQACEVLEQGDHDTPVAKDRLHAPLNGVDFASFDDLPAGGAARMADAQPSGGASASVLEARIEEIAQPVADDVECQNREDDRETGEHGHPPLVRE